MPTFNNGQGMAWRVSRILGRQPTLEELNVAGNVEYTTGFRAKRNANGPGAPQRLVDPWAGTRERLAADLRRVKQIQKNLRKGAKRG